MRLKICGFLLSLVFLLSACSEDLRDQVMEEESAELSLRKKAESDIVWNGADDKKVSVNVAVLQNTTRKNASGAKITSNAHSADFPGIYFIWDSKQKDAGYLKVAAWVFDEYQGFTLTSKESNNYWDFPIYIQKEQSKTADNCYVFFIPKVVEKDSKGKFFNINMVFIGEYLKKEKKETPINGPGDKETKGIISFQKIVKDVDGNIVPYDEWKDDAGCFTFAIYNGTTKIADGLKLVDDKLTFESVSIIAGQTYTIKESIADICTDRFEVPEDQSITASGER
ncbi:MAG: hypothetical protein LBE79_00160, partial [Tannerella sp.]|nr:hypothetical protein [Tannerella sp.]